MQFAKTHHSRTSQARSQNVLLSGLVAALLTLIGCSRDIAKEASDSDANGYLCTKCSAKFYTERSVFLPTICPKCKGEGIVEVVGYSCEKDNHLTLVGRSSARGGPACEKCGAPLSGMRLPREKELRAWGATKI